MDKSWMLKDRRSKDYEDGVEQFLNFAMIYARDLQSIRCPCRVCGNLKSQAVEEISNHLFFHGIDQSYQTWIWHGEAATRKAPPSGYAEDTFHRQVDSSPSNDVAETIEMVEAAYNYCTADPNEFRKMLEDAEKPLYPGCSDNTKLSALVTAFNFKARHQLSNTAFDELLKILGQLLPKKNEMPSSMYEAPKTMDTLGMENEKIHACPSDCILYRKEYKDATTCPTCKRSRWKLKKNSTEVRESVPAKVVWYFPLIPRFLRMYQLPKTTKNLTWHANERESDGKLRHPADSPAWKLVDHMWPDFGAEPRNLRLAISADGINPHSSLSSRYSCWPVVMVNYNLPPWLCMKRKFMMLTLLISGPQQPGNDIDVFLAPLIDDLKLLWDVGVEAFVAYRQQHFNLRVVLLWTINDFPAYGNLSGCKVKGYDACPICSEGTCLRRLKRGKKNIYVGHRKFLPINHPYRRLKKAFDGKQELGLAPSPLSGEEKKSIFFDLEYWKYLLIRHILDVMHIEKNVCESIIGTLLNIPGKTKDGISARLDLVEKDLRQELAPQVGEKQTYLPPACYTLSNVEKRRLCTTLSDLKLFPVAIRSVLPKEVRYAITRLCFFFNAICDKVVDVAKLDKIQSDICILLEKYNYVDLFIFDGCTHLRGS
ncbi:uncharacterized protein LOC131302924 [Rhododendron vialii]|uniref:uncharacterized protein LOC131302924 n=1 Tax=Rhododendron vialii TaxID=182163 RepID=UPI00265E42DF|nr:uncharacterized protein LOC131302924 [Rhododendron vialii]